MLRLLFLIVTGAIFSLTACANRSTRAVYVQSTDSIAADTTVVDTAAVDEIIRLSDDDLQRVADELGIEAAAIKAVISIEAGSEHKGFYMPGKPIVNFDLTMFRRFANRHGVKLGKYGKSHAEVFSKPNIRKYGSYQAAQHERLASAMTINKDAAIEGTFWGMFQIGGFNWKICGASSLEDFAERMSRSEQEQLALFVEFLKSNDLVKYLKAKNWAAFARRYNGPSYAKRGYHTRMAKAYQKYAAEAKAAKSNKGNVKK